MKRCAVPKPLWNDTLKNSTLFNRSNPALSPCGQIATNDEIDGSLTGPTYPDTRFKVVYFASDEGLGAAMRRLSIAIIAAALTVVCAQVASAADMPVKAPRPVAAPPPVYNWTGFYVGGHVGYLWGRTHVEEDGVVTEDGVPTNGVVGGALAGYNWQYNQFVFGLEGDFGWTNANGTGVARHHQ